MISSLRLGEDDKLPEVMSLSKDDKLPGVIRLSEYN
jgi:hypothetical protein